MSKLLLVLFSIAFPLILIYLLLIYKKVFKGSSKTNSFSKLISITKEQEHNPDINTHSWDLHKIRLNKYGRSQYKGLTFFICPQGRIYYLSEEGTKVYC